MDDLKSQPSEEPSRFVTPVESHWTSVLNGIGNGAMLGILPFAAHELVSKLRDKNISNTGPLLLAFATVSSALVGAVHGYREAQKLKTYHRNINNELLSLRAEVANKGAWVEKAQQTKDEEPTVVEKAR